MPQFITPVNGTLTQGFTSSHPGIDIGASDHSPVFAAQAATVSYAGVWGLGGNTIMVTVTDGYKTYYCHLASFLVNMGASVAQGQQIALSGGALGEAGAGNATGAHLHFEIHNPRVQLWILKHLSLWEKRAWVIQVCYLFCLQLQITIYCVMFYFLLFLLLMHLQDLIAPLLLLPAHLVAQVQR